GGAQKCAGQHQGHAALSETAWFPRPQSASDVRVLEPSSGFSAREVFELFSAEGEEWRHKVGVAGCRDGSAKASTRLLAVSGRVLKTNLARGEGSWESAERQLRSERERGLRALVWHESKLWALFRVGDVVYPLTVCPELRTLRSVEHVAERFDGWI